MSTLIHTSSATVGTIPIGRRISELMQEKGEAYSIRAFAERIGISRETLRLCLIGERPFTPSTLEKIAHGLGVTVERLRQVDSCQQEQELNRLLTGKNRTKIMMLRAQSIALELVELALGTTERGIALNNLGRAQYLQHHYNDAHATWLKAMEYAKRLQEHHTDSTLLNHVTANLMLTYTIRKEYSLLEDVLTYVESLSPPDPESLGIAYTTRMNRQNDLGNLEQARAFAYRSLEHFEQTHNERQIAIAMINIAHFEYCLGDREASAKTLEKTIQFVSDHHDLLAIAVKEYVKTLIKQGEHDKASEMVTRYQDVVKEYPEYWGKLQILYSVAAAEPSIAESVSENKAMSYQVRYLACKCLFDTYLKKGDSATALEYYKKSRMFAETKTEFYEEVGF